MIINNQFFVFFFTMTVSFFFSCIDIILDINATQKRPVRPSGEADMKPSYSTNYWHHLEHRTQLSSEGETKGLKEICVFIGAYIG